MAFACDLSGCEETATFRILYSYRFGSRKQYADTRFAHVCTDHSSLNDFPPVLGTALKLEPLT